MMFGNYALMAVVLAVLQAPQQTPATPVLPPLPVAVSSFGATVVDSYLYIYGGHAGKTHSYDTKSVLGSFHRVKIDGGTTWEELPGGPILQGLNLVSHAGKVYRVGGMEPKNAPGEPTDNVSTASVACYDPKTKLWEELPPLPAGRSSHDVVVVGTKLVVVGGWQMKGKADKSVWHDTALILDLNQPKDGWKVIKQPFQRRALTAAVVGNKVYVVGGLTAEGSERSLDILDLDAGSWSSGPEFPGSERAGFSPAAAVVDGRLIVNTLAGPLYRLTADGKDWEQVGTAKTKRMVARLLPHGSNAVILVGGAGGGGNVSEVEIITLAK